MFILIIFDKILQKEINKKKLISKPEIYFEDIF